MNKSSTIQNCTIISFPKITNRAGNITPLENLVDIPFEIKRVFYLYDIPGGESRGAHSHKECHQLLVALSGSFEVKMNDGKDEKTVFLNRPFSGLHIPPLIWAEEINFSSGSVCLVITSHKFDASDYIRDYDEYLKIKNG
jgi:hypothetical protein